MSDQAGSPTTGLLHAVGYLKDNRLLPNGFPKSSANADIAVRGAATGDEDFVAGGDKVRYRIDLGAARGPIDIEVELLYQSVGYRWAHNLDGYDAFEPQRFVRYYRESTEHASSTLARASTRISPP